MSVHSAAWPHKAIRYKPYSITLLYITLHYFTLHYFTLHIRPNLRDVFARLRGLVAMTIGRGEGVWEVGGGRSSAGIFPEKIRAACILEMASEYENAD